MPSFFQSPPTLLPPFQSDPFVRPYLSQALPQKRNESVSAKLMELDPIAVEFHKRQLMEQRHEPVLTQWDPWGKRIDRIELSPIWRDAGAITAKHGLVALPYEKDADEFSRIHQFVANYLVQPSLELYSCPLAMTDGAASTLRQSGNETLIAEIVPHLVSRDPLQFWTSGQWMTERIGGSDVSQTETIAENENGQWFLSGTKWFTSATTSEVALTLARPAGNPPGSSGLALFLVELRDERQRLQGIEINRLKDKLGTRKLPTAELTLKRTPARLVGEAKNGVRAITPMLSVTRTWNTVMAASLLRRGVTLAKEYAKTRFAFGQPIIELPAHARVLANLECYCQGTFLLGMRLAELLGKQEHQATVPWEDALLRTLTSLAKLETARQAVACLAEVMECFGGAGYVEDTGIPRLIADAHVLPIWEGTTNVLSADALRSLRSEETQNALTQEFSRLQNSAPNSVLPYLELAIKNAQSLLQKASTNPALSRYAARSLAQAIQLGLVAKYQKEESPVGVRLGNMLTNQLDENAQHDVILARL